MCDTNGPRGAISLIQFDNSDSRLSLKDSSIFYKNSTNASASACNQDQHSTLCDSGIVGPILLTLMWKIAPSCFFLATMGNQVSRTNCFFPKSETILGIDEFTLVTLSKAERESRFLRKEIQCFVNESTNQAIPFGSFSTISLQTLKEHVAKMKLTAPQQERDPVPLQIRSGVDIASLQGRLSTDDNAMVQVASNFNCLENPSRRTRIDSGHLVDSAYRDRTQGPAAVFGALPSYLYRCHFYQGGQSLGHPVNLLQYAQQYFGTPQVGKLTLDGTQTELLNDNDVGTAAERVCLGMHQDCPVLFGRSNGKLTYNDPVIKVVQHAADDLEVLHFPLVDQVFSASINLNDYGPEQEQNPPSTTAISNLNRSLLRAAYEGIYLAAILRKRRKLYLTLVGGGSFANPISLIVEELQRAHNQYASHPQCLLEECVICIFSKETEHEVRSCLDQN